jgi:hypothetical protein
MIERSDSIQVEKNLKGGFITKSKISWMSACDFELTYITSSNSKIDSIAEYIKKTPLEAHIIKVEKDYYVFESKMKGITQKVVDTMWFQSK